MLQVLHMDVAKVDRDVARVAIDIHVCYKRLFEIFHLFQMHVASVLSVCCICFTQMLHVFVPNVLFVLDVCCSKFFFGVASVFISQVLNETARVTRCTSTGGGASAIRSRHMRSPCA